MPDGPPLERRHAAGCGACSESVDSFVSCSARRLLICCTSSLQLILARSRRLLSSACRTARQLHAGRPAAWMPQRGWLLGAQLIRRLVRQLSSSSVVYPLDIELSAHPTALGDCFGLHAGRPVPCMPDGPWPRSLSIAASSSSQVASARRRLPCSNTLRPSPLLAHLYSARPPLSGTELYILHAGRPASCMPDGPSLVCSAAAASNRVGRCCARG